MSDASQDSQYAIPPPRPRNERKPTDAVRALVRRTAATIGTTPDQFGQERRSLPENVLDDFVYAVVDGVGPARPRERVVVPTHAELTPLFDSPDVSDLVCLRFIAELRGDPNRFYFGEPYAWMYQHRALDLEGIAVLARAYPFGERSVADHLAEYGRSIVEGWADEDVWPFFARRPSLIDFIVLAASDRGEDARRAAIELLGRFPTPPRQALRLLYDHALGARKTFRRDARMVLARDPLRALRVREALVSRDAIVRANAAAWSAEVADGETIDAVERAITAETDDAAFSSMIGTLETCGRSVEPYVGLERLAEDAKRGLKKGIPKDLAWFPFDALPAVRIEATGALVPPTSVQWLLVSANRAKSGTPPELLRRRVAQFDSRDRHALGAFVFSAWMQHDVRPAMRATASARADRDARSLVEAADRHSFFGGDLLADSPFEGMTESQISTYLFGKILGNPIESAVANKGLLAIAAACANGAVVAPAAAYIRRWYGMRPVQGKTLLEMLAWIDDPRAVATLLSIATRFRTRSFQDVALEQIRDVARRRGWTVDELADRTIPTAGFNDDGILELSYGERVFQARIASDGRVSLADASGRLIESLPAPRTGDGEAAAKEARAALARARKELTAIVSDQTLRLYEAMCSGRTWRACDARRYLVMHPIVGRLVSRLVFATTSDPANIASFRPTIAGDFVGPGGERIAVDENAEIAVAHDLRVPRDDAERWRASIANATIEPLFQQFGSDPFEISSVRRHDESFTGVAGFTIAGRTLLGQIRKRGWARGPAHDANRYYSYDKRFPSVGILAVLSFTGNEVPEDERVVALESLTFERLASGPNFGAPKLPFSDVPPVLVAEAVADVRAFARAGTGFDPNFRPPN